MHWGQSYLLVTASATKGLFQNTGNITWWHEDINIYFIFEWERQYLNYTMELSKLGNKIHIFNDFKPLCNFLFIIKVKVGLLLLYGYKSIA